MSSSMGGHRLLVCIRAKSLIKLCVAKSDSNRASPTNIKTLSTKFWSTKPVRDYLWLKFLTILGSKTSKRSTICRSNLSRKRRRKRNNNNNNRFHRLSLSNSSIKILTHSSMPPWKRRRGNSSRIRISERSPSRSNLRNRHQFKRGRVLERLEIKIAVVWTTLQTQMTISWKNSKTS